MWADVAQLVEQLIRNQQVVGSNPTISSIHRLASYGRNGKDEKNENAIQPNPPNLQSSHASHSSHFSRDYAVSVWRRLKMHRNSRPVAWWRGAVATWVVKGDEHGHDAAFGFVGFNRLLGGGGFRLSYDALCGCSRGAY